MRLYALNTVDTTEEPPEKTFEWRESCSSTLMMTVRELRCINNNYFS